ncbi:MAG: MFS transporter [Sporolactobacillus sp.]
MKRKQTVLPPFQKKVWWLLLGYTLSLFGSGLSEPYLILYLDQIRGISLSISGMIIATSGISGAAILPVCGLIIDKVGANKLFLLTLFIAAWGRIAFAFANNEPLAFFAAALSGAGAAGSWNALSLILAASVDESAKTEIFGIAYALQNIGSGLGSALGGLMIHTHALYTFQSIFMIDAMTFLLFAIFSKRGLEGSVKLSINRKQGKRKNIQIRVALKDKIQVKLSFGYFLIAIVMTGFTTIVFPQWVIGQEQLSTQVIGYAFLANSLVIVFCQFFIYRAWKKIRQTLQLAIASSLLAMGYAVVFVSGLTQFPWAAIGSVSAFALTGVGEALLFSALPALVNDCAPNDTKGFYNSMINFAWQAGFIIGPFLVGVMLRSPFSGGLFPGEVTVLLLVSYLFFSIRHLISKAADQGG